MPKQKKALGTPFLSKRNPKRSFLYTKKCVLNRQVRLFKGSARAFSLFSWKLRLFYIILMCLHDSTGLVIKDWHKILGRIPFGLTWVTYLSDLLGERVKKKERGGLLESLFLFCSCYWLMGERRKTQKERHKSLK